MPLESPYRVLALEGGGMRGIYQAAYLSYAADRVQPQKAAKRAVDVGGIFDLIVGTSTGGLIACALAAEVPLEKIKALYLDHGDKIFPNQGMRWFAGLGMVYRSLGGGAKEGEVHLRYQLQTVFGSETLGALYTRRQIALAIPTIDMGTYKAVMLKTQHLGRLDGRNNENSLVDVCLATSAAPILRTMARFDVGGATKIHLDGGLWANDPSLVAMAEAVEILSDLGQEDRPIQIFTLGSSAPFEGEIISKNKLFRSALGWKGGLGILKVSMCAQSSAYSYLTRKLAEQRQNGSLACRLPQLPGSAAVQQRASEMDDARSETLEMLIARAHADVDHALSERTHQPGLAAFFDALANAPLIEPLSLPKDEFT